jgi:hypothetical protein
MTMNMKRSLLALVAVMVMLVTVVAPTIVTDDNSTNGDTATCTFHGFIKISGALKDNNEIRVIVYYYDDETSSYLYKSSTGIVAGEFTVTDVPYGLDAGKYAISIELNGYVVSNVSKYISGTSSPVITASTAYFFTSLPTIETGNIYTVSEDNANSINLTNAYGTVTGVITIKDTQTKLNGVKVSMTDVDTGSIVKTVYTSNGGVYLFDKFPVGTYTITISMDGYETVTDKIDVTASEGSITHDYSVVAKTQGWFTMDLTHFLMIVCGVIGIFVIAAATIYRIRLPKKAHKKRAADKQ